MRTLAGANPSVTAMLTALTHTKNPESTRAQKTTSLMMCAAQTAADKDAAIHTDLDMSVMISDHDQAKADAKKAKAGAGAGVEAKAAAAADDSIMRVCYSRPRKKRNRTTKKKQTLAQRAAILHQDHEGKLFYDSESDLPPEGCFHQAWRQTW